MIASLKQFEPFLKQALSGQPGDWPRSSDESWAARFLAATGEHGLHPLLHEALREREDVPAEVRSVLERTSMVEVARKARLEPEVMRLLARMESEGARPVLMKGLALAYTHYAQPHLRPHADCDLLLGRDELLRIEGALRELGYRRVDTVAGELVCHQETWSKTDESGLRIFLDFHWRISNPVVFSDVLRPEELFERSIAIPALGASARGLCDLDALVLACIHRVAHHRHEEKLIWARDIHLLANALSPADRARVRQTVVSRGVLAVCADGFRRAREWFGTEVPAEWLAPRDDGEEEPSSAFLRNDLRRIDLLRLDLRALPPRRAIRLLREHVFPSRAYMRRRYDVRRPALLPLWYLFRLLNGIASMLRSR